MRRSIVHVPGVIVALLSLAASVPALAQTFTPELTPTSVSVTAGDPAGANFQAAINHDPGFNASIRVYFDTVPSGLTFTPVEQFLNPPYNAINFNVRAAPGTAPGTYDVNVVFSSNQTKTDTLRVVVSAPPSFEVSAVPDRFDVRHGEFQNVTVTLRSLNGFSGTVNLSTDHNPSRLDVDPSSFTLTLAANGTATRVIAVRAREGAATGSANFLVTAAHGTQTKVAPIFVNITAAPQPDFALVANGPGSSVTAGQPATIRVTATGQNGFNGIIHVSAVAGGVAGASVTPANFTLTAGQFQDVVVNVPASASGTVTVTFTGTSGTISRSASAGVVFTPAAQPSFALLLTPQQITVRAGESTQVVVSSTAGGGFNSPISVTGPAAQNGVSASPQNFTLNAGSSQLVTIMAGMHAQATTMPLQLLFRGTSGNLSAEAPLSVTVLAAAAGAGPVVTAIHPASLVVPARSQEVIVVGRNFAPGVVAISEDPANVQIESTRFLTPTSAAVRVTVGPNASTSRGYRLTMRNPDGGLSADDVRLTLFAADDLRAPLAVTTIAIRYPNPGQSIASGKGIFAAGQLATTGTGTIRGRWKLRSVANPHDAGFVFDQFTATVAGGYLITTDRPCRSIPNTTAQICTAMPIPTLPWSAAGYDLELTVDEPAYAEPARVRVVFQADSATELTIYAPEDGAVVDSELPRLSWTLVPGASGYEVELQRLSEDPAVRRTIRFGTAGTNIIAEPGVEHGGGRITTPEWRPSLQDLQRIGPGTFLWRVTAVFPGDVRGTASRWRSISIRDSALTSARLVALVASSSFDTVALDQEISTADQAAVRKNYVIAPNVMATDGKEQPASGRASVSTQGDLGGASAEGKFTGDLSYAGAFDPNRLVQESRNWLIRAGTSEERLTGVGALFGYTTPDFTHGAEFLVSGTAMTGVVAKARLPFGSVSYYQPVSTAVHGVMSGLQQTPEIRSAAFATPEGRRYQIRLIGLEVDEEGDTLFAQPSSSLRTFGVFGRYDISSALSLVAEAAQGTLEVEDSGSVSSREGTAMRVGMTGTRGTLSYSANIRNIGANFVNPANRGIYPGGVADRLMFDVAIGKTVGETSLNIAARRQDQGRSSESTLPDANQTGFNVGASRRLGRVFANVSANWTEDRGAADVATFVQETRREQTGLSASFSESFGRLSLSQSVSLQRTRDAISPFADQDMTSVSLSASGSPLQNVTISASLSGSRTEGVPVLGVTDTLTASLQPSFAIPGLSLSFQPSASFSRSENAVLSNESASEQYNASLQWSPAWLGSLAAAQLSSSWSRSAFGGVTAPLTQTWSGSLTLRVSKNRGMPLFPTNPMAGAVPPPQPPNEPQPAAAGSGSND
ncbi:MAG TPA: hypothetical protein VF701_20265 [Thermoanaerobaculia bacterium]